MERVTGIGGVFFRAKDPDALNEWYKEYLEIDPEVYPNGVFARLADPEGNPIQLWEPRGKEGT